jgi:hypothetical protein
MKTTKKNQTFNIPVTKEVYEQLCQDQQHFSKVVGGGDWTLNNVLEEYIKILKTIKK